jgi:hypothetical protein
VRSARATAALAAGAAALVLAAPLAASPPTPGSGAGTILLRAPTETRTADGNVIQERHTMGVVTGAFDGTYVEDVRGVIHKDGLVTFHGFMTFTGIAGDCGVGTVYVELEGRAIAGVGIAEGRLRTVDEGAATVKVHAMGAFEQLATTFTYAGQFHCD